RVFFFRAEDGIRDPLVTGVQTCALPISEHHAAPPTAGALGGSETVLLVEDDEGVRELAELLLSEGGYVVLSASDGNEALLVAERHPGSIDVLLTDVVMPGLGGVALAEAIEHLRPGIAVVYMSGYRGDALLAVTGSAA